MSTRLNTDAPPAEAPKSGDIIRLEPFPRSDTLVLTTVAFNYIEKHPFERKDEKTGQEYVKEAPALEFFFGAVVDGKPYIAKTWPQLYSLSERANYYKWYEAAVGRAPTTGTRPSDMIGKHVLAQIKVEDKKSAKGTAYRVTSIKSIAAVPSVLKDTGTPVDKLRPALDAILAGNDGKGE